MGWKGIIAGGLEALGPAGLQMQRAGDAMDLESMRQQAESERMKNLEEIRSKNRVSEYDQQKTRDVQYGTDMLPVEAARDRAKAATEGDMRVDVARRSPRVLSAGSSEVVDGKIDVTAPEKPVPQEHLDYYKASANRLNAEAEAIRNGEKYRDKPVKPAVPMIKLEKDGNGNPVLFDANSGAIGVIVAGEPAKEAKSHIFGKDEPGVPEKPPKTIWRTADGRELPNGLSDLYPAISDRVSGASSGGGGAGQPAGAPAVGAVDEGFRFKGGNPRDRANWEPVSAPANAPRRTSSAPAAAAQEPAFGGEPGQTLDRARADVAAADSLVRSFGLARRRDDREGFSAAQSDLLRKREALSAAQKAYEESMGSQPAAFNLPRRRQ
jgi:hypothetical protein